MDPNAACVRQILKGVGVSSEQHPEWNITLNPGLSHQLTGPLPWRPAGVIACTWSAAQSQALFATGIPLVDLSISAAHRDWSPLAIDENAVGAAALQHLRERGYRHFGLITADQDLARIHDFRRAAAAHGLPCLHFDQAWPSYEVDPLTQVSKLAAWLASAPRPLGLFFQ